MTAPDPTTNPIPPQPATDALARVIAEAKRLCETELVCDEDSYAYAQARATLLYGILPTLIAACERQAEAQRKVREFRAILDAMIADNATYDDNGDACDQHWPSRQVAGEIKARMDALGLTGQDDGDEAAR